MNVAHRFVLDLATLTTVEAVGKAFCAFAAARGFDAVACGSIRELPNGIRSIFYFTSWPNDWMRHYRDEKGYRNDVVIALARLRNEPFTWSEVLADQGMTPEQRKLSEAVHAHGWRDGFVVPIHRADGSVGLVSLASPHIGLDPVARLDLHLTGLYTFARCEEIDGFPVADMAVSELTPREIECLHWMLEGKSDGDIGSILDISPATVHFHLERAKKKFGVRTRVQAAAKAVLNGIV